MVLGVPIFKHFRVYSEKACLWVTMYHKHSMYWMDILKEQSDQGQHCVPFHLHILSITAS